MKKLFNLIGFIVIFIFIFYIINFIFSIRDKPVIFVKEAYFNQEDDRKLIKVAIEVPLYLNVILTNDMLRSNNAIELKGQDLEPKLNYHLDSYKTYYLEYEIDVVAYQEEYEFEFAAIFSSFFSKENEREIVILKEKFQGPISFQPIKTQDLRRLLLQVEDPSRNRKRSLLRDDGFDDSFKGSKKIVWIIFVILVLLVIFGDKRNLYLMRLFFLQRKKILTRKKIIALRFLLKINLKSRFKIDYLDKTTPAILKDLNSKPFIPRRKELLEEFFVITDDYLFKGIEFDDEVVSKKLFSIVKKIIEYRYLKKKIKD